MAQKQKKSHKLDPNKIQILDFRILKGALDSPFTFSISDVETYGYKVGFDMGFNFDEQRIKSEFKIRIDTNSGAKNEIEASGMFHFTFVFGLEGLDKLASHDIKENTVEVMPSLANAISSITYSTSRGILMSRFKGTALENFILPVISPNDLLDMPLDSVET
jgi:hypothetical protein